MPKQAAFEFCVVNMAESSASYSPESSASHSHCESHSHCDSLPRSSDSKAWPLPPWTWTPPRPGWPIDSSIDSLDRPTKRTQQKRTLSEQRTEPASAEEFSVHCLRIQADVKRRAARVAYWKWRQLWSPGHFSFCSDSPINSAPANESFDDSSTMSSDDVCSPCVGSSATTIVSIP